MQREGIKRLQQIVLNDYFLKIHISLVGLNELFLLEFRSFGGVNQYLCKSIFEM